MTDYGINEIYRGAMPEITFGEELALPLHTQKPPRWNESPVREDEVAIDSLAIARLFPDPEGLLETSYDDFTAFMRCCGICESVDGFFLRTEYKETECFEAYCVTVTRSGIVIAAADTEGIRRALVYIQDEMHRREGARLALGEVKRAPFIKDRISRCYFTPASHAEIEERENELCDGVDYYPDGYLCRLMHDGINALWLGASLKYLVKSPLVPEYGADAERRMKKLNTIIEKCRRYGIRVFLFAVDPASSYCNPELLRHPELMDDCEGAECRLLCPSQPIAVEYLKGAVRTLFTEARGLAGYINLSVGESLSTCASDGATLHCSRCRARFGTVGKALAFVEGTIADAMHEVAPEAKYISWTYEMRNWADGDIRELCRSRSKGVIHLQNFEDDGRPVQLGKERAAYDYWLSYTGPGRLFEKTLGYNKEVGTATYAKIQICSSHEISTVPYVIAPGILFDKYRYFLENGIEGVMGCWFFGNYPCLMSKAASELSFLPFPESKEEFLTRLAGIYWGSDAHGVTEAWGSFERGYRAFPVNGAFEWLGPMQDSPVSPLHLLPKDRPMPSSWLTSDEVGGDRIGECMCNGHTHEEALALVGEVVSNWSEGTRLLEGIAALGDREREEQKTVARATELILRSGYNVLRFYYLRRLLGIGSGENRELLGEMRKIALEEIEISKLLLPICERDNRIGYHSEAHGHKIHNDKLSWRIDRLRELLETEFPKVEERIDRGLAPLEFYTGVGHSVIYSVGEDEWLPLVGRCEGDALTRIKIEEQDGGYILTIKAQGLDNDYIVIRPEYRIFHPTCPLRLSAEGLSFASSARPFFTFAISPKAYALNPDTEPKELGEYGCTVRAKGDEYTFTLYIDRGRFGMEPKEPFRLDIERFDKNAHYDLGPSEAKEALCFSERTFSRLVHGTYSPECYAFVKARGHSPALL